MCCNRSGVMEYRRSFNQVGRLEPHCDRRYQERHIEYGDVAVLVAVDKETPKAAR